MKGISVVAIVLLLAAIESRGAETPPFDYRPITQADLERVQSDWQNRDLESQNIKVVYEEDRDGFRLMVVRHEISSRAHFGAIFVPDVDDLSAAPVVVLPDHLEQNNPTIDIEINIQKYLEHEPLDILKEFIMILPAFRGRLMSYQERVWFSRGDFLRCV